MSMYHGSQKMPAIHDPARMPGRQATYRAAQRTRWDGLTPAQMCEMMDVQELRRNARRGGVAAIAEEERRAAESAPTAPQKGEDNR